MKPKKKSKRLSIYVEGARGAWRAYFSIDQQSFHVCERETKKEALWFAKCLRHAFGKLQFKSNEVTI